MELNGTTTADRWEEISNHLSELSQKISKEKTAIHSLLTELKKSEKNLDKLTSDLEKLSGLAYKEVLREESGTLNDEMPEYKPEIASEPAPAIKPRPELKPEPKEPVIPQVPPEQTALPLDIKE